MPPVNPSFGHVRRADKDHLMQLSVRHHKSTIYGLLDSAPPPTWDSRQLGIVGPIKNQKSCGSCWDFSGTGMVEIAFYKAGILKPDGSEELSEEYTLSCGRNGGCGGDDNVTVLEWAKATGLPLSKDYGPYTARAQSCAFKQSMTLYKINDWGFADGSEGNGITPVENIKSAIMLYGCVGAAIAADNAFVNMRPGTVFDGNSRSINHDIILCGWDDSKGAWLLRNSWDVDFADQGYCWIKFGANSVGTEAVWCRVDVTDPQIDWAV